MFKFLNRLKYTLCFLLIYPRNVYLSLKNEVLGSTLFCPFYAVLKKLFLYWGVFHLVPSSIHQTGRHEKKL